MSLKTGFLKLFKWNTQDDEDLNSNFDIDAAMNDNWDMIDNAVSNLSGNKVDKVDGKQLSTEDYSTEEKNKLDKIASGAQVNKIESLTLNGKTLPISNKGVNIKDEEVTNARKSTIKDKTFTSVTARIEELEEEVDGMETTRGHVYGIRRKITNNSSSTWERLFDSVGKVANATKNGGPVENNFDSLAPWSEIKSCNYDLTTKKINAWFGDANFKFDGSKGDVFTYYPKTYWKIYQENDYDYVLLADYPKAGFTEIDGFFMGRYNASVVADDGLLHTYSGLVPTTNKTIGAFRTLAKALGDNFSQLDWRYFVVQMLYLVEYANYNSQSMLGNGIQSRKYLRTLVAENNTNRAIVGSSSGYYVGQIIRIGTSDGGTQVADARKITAIEAYDENGVTGSAITFDGAAVNIAVDNFVCTMAQITGQCDTLGMKSGCLNNDGYHSMIYRGIENIFAHIWQWVDGINMISGKFYICKNHSLYASDTTENYKQLGYNALGTEGYAKELDLDVDEPFFRFPKAVGGGSNTYLCDYYYNNATSIAEGAKRVALVGGGFNVGALDGLWSWSSDDGSSNADWNFGARVLIDNQI
jgi:hypothetical protein